MAELKAFNWKRWLIGTATIVGLYVLLWWWPNYQIEHNGPAAGECLSAIEDSGVGDPHACAPTMWLAKLLPWTHADAKAADHARSIDRLALELAASRDLDRAARDRAAQVALDDSDEPPDELWWDAGAYDMLLAHATQLRDGVALDHAVTAALRTGNIAALRSFVDLDPARPSTIFATERARLACLFDGNVKHALDQAYDAANNDSARSFHGSDVPTIKLLVAHARESIDQIAALCDPTAPASTDARMTTTRWLQTLAGRPPRPVSTDERPANRSESIATIETMQLSGDPDPTHFQIDLDGPDPWNTPWEILDAKRHPLSSTFIGARSPAIDDATAPHLVALADAASGDAATKLRHNALDLALSAAGGWLRRGELGHARASLAIATTAAHHRDLADREAQERHAVIPYLHLAGDLDAALAEQAAAPHRMNADVEADDLEHALLLVSAGKIDEAFAALAPLPELSSDRYNRTYPAGDVAWLRAALAVRLHRDIGTPLPIYDELDAGTSVTFYVRAALAPADQQRALRSHRVPRPPSSTMVEPAVLYLVGQLAGAGDVELWLDYVSADAFSSDIDSMLYAAARAEAARWRGDATAAAQWDARLVTLRTLVKDDRSDYLVHTLTDR